MNQQLKSKELLIAVLRQGQRVSAPQPLGDIRQRTIDQLAQFHDGIKRRIHPHTYPVGLDQKLFDSKRRLILKARGMESGE